MARPIGIICAIPQELVHLRAVLEQGVAETLGGRRYDAGLLDGVEVVLAEAGIGKVNTAMSATVLATRMNARILVFTGVAGGLDPALAIGDLVIADNTVQHDAGVIENETLAPYQAGHVPFFNPTERFGYPVEAELRARLEQRVAGFTPPPIAAAATGAERRTPRVVFGTILAGDQYIHCEATRMRLHRRYHGQAVEMEGGALGQVAEAFGVPYLDLRALSDLAGADSRGDFAAFVDAVADSSARLLRHLLPVL